MFGMQWKERAIRSRLVVLLLASLLLPTAAALGEPQLANFKVSYLPVPLLEDPTHLSEGLKSVAYCSSVGGIAFGGVAVGADGQKVLALKYDGNLPDGQRLQVILAGAGGVWKTVTAPIYNWQLVPIARFAAKDQHACFTIFGKLKDAAETQRRMEQGDKIMNYQAAFADTLLGLRLFQADILILYPQCADLPTENGRYLLGAGESKPDVPANQRALAQVQRVSQNLPGDPFRSYIICDSEVTITFAAKGGRLVITGDPIWHCWKFSTDDPRKIDDIQNLANAEANAVVQAELRRDTAVLSPPELRSKYTEAYQQEVHRRVFDRVASEKLLVRMPVYSRALSAEIARQQGVNPTVYAALANTMRYAALFRHARQVDGRGYDVFVASLAGVPLTPEVRTPTIINARQP